MENNTSKIILGLIGATAVGVAIGLLIAPEKGEDMRKKIVDTANDLGSKASDLISTGKEKLTEITGKITKQAEGLGKEASNRANTAKTEWEKM